VFYQTPKSDSFQSARHPKSVSSRGGIYTPWIHSARHPIVLCVITFRVSRRRREMYTGHARLCVCLSVCVSVCLSLAASPYYCTDPDVTLGNGRQCWGSYFLRIICYSYKLHVDKSSLLQLLLLFKSNELL